MLENRNAHSQDYETLRFLPRPRSCRLRKPSANTRVFQDAAAADHFSGRIRPRWWRRRHFRSQILAEHGILIGTHVLRCQGICDPRFDLTNLSGEIEALHAQDFPTLSPQPVRR